MYFGTNKKLKTIIFSLFFSVFLMLFFTSTSHAGWKIYKRAQIKSGQGHYLRFESLNGEYIRLMFGLSRQDEGVFLNKLPIYRVDDNDIHIIKKDKSYKNLKVRTGYYIYWIISNGETSSKELNEFINGQEVVFQYYRDDGKIMEAVFSLDGIKEAIEEILN